MWARGLFSCGEGRGRPSLPRSRRRGPALRLEPQLEHQQREQHLAMLAESRQMLCLQPCDLPAIEYSRRGDGTGGERVLHERLKRTAQPASHRCLKALLAMIDARRRQPLRGDLFQNALLIEATNLEIRRNGHHFLDEAMIEIRHTEFQ